MPKSNTSKSVSRMNTEALEAMLATDMIPLLDDDFDMTYGMLAEDDAEEIVFDGHKSLRGAYLHNA